MGLAFQRGLGFDYSPSTETIVQDQPNLFEENGKRKNHVDI